MEDPFNIVRLSYIPVSFTGQNTTEYNILTNAWQVYTNTQDHC